MFVLYLWVWRRVQWSQHCYVKVDRLKLRSTSCIICLRLKSINNYIQLVQFNSQAISESPIQIHILEWNHFIYIHFRGIYSKNKRNYYSESNFNFNTLSRKDKRNSTLCKQTDRIDLDTKASLSIPGVHLYSSPLSHLSWSYNIFNVRGLSSFISSFTHGGLEGIYVNLKHLINV